MRIKVKDTTSIKEANETYRNGITATKRGDSVVYNIRVKRA